MKKKNRKIVFNSCLNPNLSKFNSQMDIHVHNIHLFREYMNLYSDKKSFVLPGKYAKLSNLILPKIINYNSTRNAKISSNETLLNNLSDHSLEMNDHRPGRIEALSLREMSNEGIASYNHIKVKYRSCDSSNRLNQFLSSPVRDTALKKKLKNLLIMSPMHNFPICNNIVDRKISPTNLFKNDLIKNMLNSDTYYNEAWK